MAHSHNPVNLQAASKTKNSFFPEILKEIYKKRIGYFFILPLFVFLILFIYKPFFITLINSFYQSDINGKNPVFVGLLNFKKLLKDELFFTSLKNLGYLFVFGFIPAFLSPLIVAELIFNQRSERLQYFFRTIFTVPMVVPTIVTLYMWRFIYYPQIGVLSRLFEMFGLQAPNFLGDANLVKAAIILVGFPWVAGFYLLVYFSALQGLPTSIFESAYLEGCSTWKRIIHIDLPLIKNKLKFIFILAITGLIEGYERIMILTDGGPMHASLVPGLRMYQVAFGEAIVGRLEYASTMGLVLFIISLVISILSLKFKDEVYEY